MENLKFTKGEWFSEKYKVYTNAAGRTLLADLTPFQNAFEYTPETEANAKLIAAAPELLEALMMSQRLLLSIEGESFKEWPEFQFIQSAINKATK